MSAASSGLAIRVLTAADAAAFWHLRSEALEKEPTAFGGSMEEHRETSIADAAARIAPNADAIVVGVFADGTLRGMAGLARDRPLKRRHRATVWGVYLGADLRGRGVGRRLLESVIARAREMPGLERLVLTADSADPRAIGLYRSVGFLPFGREPAALKIGQVYVDNDHMSLDLNPARRSD